MTVILLFFFILCLVQSKTAARGTFFHDYLSKENTTPVQGIFVFLVFFRHYFDYAALNGPYDGFASRFNSAMGMLLITMFLFYSGYGVICQIADRGTGYVKNLPRKTLRLYLHFLLAFVLYVLLKLCFGVAYPVKKLLTCAVLWDTIGNDYAYILGILGLYLLTWLSFTLFKKRRIPALLLLTAGTAAMVLVLRVFKAQFFYNAILCYPLGAWFSVLRERFRSYRADRRPVRQPSVWYLAALVALFVLFALSTSFYRTYEWVLMARNLIFTLLVLLLTMKIRLDNAFLRFLGEHVFSMYILHRLLMITLDRTGLIESHPYLCFVGAFLCVMLLAVVFDKLLALFDRAVFKKNPQTVPPEPGRKATLKELVVLGVLSYAVLAAVFGVLGGFDVRREVTVTALDESNEAAENSQIYLRDLSVNAQTYAIPTPTEGTWTSFNDMLCWFRADDARADAAQTDTVVLPVPPKEYVRLEFLGNRWKGMVRVSMGNWETTVDTYRATDGGETVAVRLPGLSYRQLAYRILAPAALLIAILLLAYLVLYVPFLKKKKPD